MRHYQPTHAAVLILCSWPLLIPIGWAAQPAAHQHGTGQAMSTPASTSQHPMPSALQAASHGASGSGMGTRFGPVSDLQEASGTAWQPAATPMHAHHSMPGEWQTMMHYNAFLAYDDQSGPRGDEQFNSVNWLMLMARRQSADHELMFRGMFSLEPWTTTGEGYPLLFQSGEAYHGRPLIDRQHPHDFFMELSGRYRRLVNRETALSLYVAPSGEPALGPAAFPHRMSAMDNPAAPISHHWLDSTHISFGVLTAGIARDQWQVEGSWFNGREPDEERWGIDLTRLDSYAGRVSWNPTSEWSAQASVGYLKSPEELHPEDDLWRSTASLMHLKKIGGESHLATTFAWGRNDTHGGKTDAVTIESAWMNGRMSVFGRAEYVEKTGEELDVAPEERRFGIKQVGAGVTHELVRNRPWQLALGGAVTYTFQPETLDAIYGNNPVGFWIFLRLRPAAMRY